jgi:calcineurin-like phosphoesterase family protein
MQTFFTSDTHFHHAAIIGYCNRPFRNVDEMNRTMIERWNARVQPGDVVWHLGDFAFGPSSNISVVLAALQGEVNIVLGNHDRSLNQMRQRFGKERAWSGATQTIDGVLVHMSHHPKVVTTGLNLHGHVHDAWARRGSCINVGVDVRDFEPKTLQELLDA